MTGVQTCALPISIAAFKVYGEVLLHPEQISAKFDSWVLALIAAVSRVRSGR